MPFDNLFRKRQSQTCSSVFLCGQERLEQACNVFWTHTLTIIGNEQLHMCAALSQAKRNSSSLWDGVEGIRQQIKDDLQYLSRVDFGNCFFREVAHEVNLLSGNASMMNAESGFRDLDQVCLGGGG